MPIVYACAASHAPGIRAWTEACPLDQRERLFAGFEEIKAGLTAAKPDVVILLTSEHWANFFEHHGAFCIGRGESFEGPGRGAEGPGASATGFCFFFFCRGKNFRHFLVKNRPPLLDATIKGSKNAFLRPRPRSR